MPLILPAARGRGPTEPAPATGAARRNVQVTDPVSK